MQPMIKNLSRNRENLVHRSTQTKMHKVHTQFNRLIVEATQRWWVPGCSRRSSLADGSRKHHTLPPAKAGHCEKWLAWVFFNLSEKILKSLKFMKSKLPPRRFFGGFTRKVPIFFQISSNHSDSPTPKLQGQRDQGCRADGKALSDGCCGVSRRIQRIGAAAHFGIEQGHLLAETCFPKGPGNSEWEKTSFQQEEAPKTLQDFNSLQDLGQLLRSK